jgi:hypothetical protein
MTRTGVARYSRLVMTPMQPLNEFRLASAFVVQFRTATDFERDRVEGRIEHVASGVTAHFSSAGELLALLAKFWKDVVDLGPERL